MRKWREKMAILTLAALISRRYNNCGIWKRAVIQTDDNYSAFRLIYVWWPIPTSSQQAISETYMVFVETAKGAGESRMIDFPRVSSVYSESWLAVRRHATDLGASCFRHLCVTDSRSGEPVAIIKTSLRWCSPCDGIYREKEKYNTVTALGRCAVWCVGKMAGKRNRTNNNYRQGNRNCVVELDHAKRNE